MTINTAHFIWFGVRQYAVECMGLRAISPIEESLTCGLPIQDLFGHRSSEEQHVLCASSQID